MEKRFGIRHEYGFNVIIFFFKYQNIMTMLALTCIAIIYIYNLNILKNECIREDNYLMITVNHNYY